MRWSEAEYARYIQNTKQYTNNQKPKNKYYSQKTWIDGICFDSKKEADYYCQLKLLTKAGEIKGFCRQARFVVTEGVGSIERGTEYVADFVIFNNDGTSRIVDTKGVKTNEFKLKMKSFREKYPTLKVELE